MTAETDYSFRIGTMNTQLDSWLFEIDTISNAGAAAEFVLSLPSRIDEVRLRRVGAAKMIAERVLTSGFDYDVLAFNEVFQEDARAALLAALSPTYPHVVAREPATSPPLPDMVLSFLPDEVKDALSPLLSSLDLEDSGLMLFSRFPITRVDYHEFDISGLPFRGFPDCLAAKGAVYVELFNNRTGRPLSVVATHLQEDKDEWRSIRAEELAQIRALLAANLTPHDLQTRDVVVLGDLNVVANLTASGSVDGTPPTPDADEYASWFGPAAPPGALGGVKDTWLWHQSAFDRGLTSDSGLGIRLDLVLHNEGPRLLVPQHLTLAYNLCDPSGASLSDHLGVQAEFNHTTAYATPRAARVAPLAGEWSTHTSIDHPGGMQWHRIDTAGAYGIAAAAAPISVGGAPVQLPYEVYAATDLSRPLRVFAGLTSEVWTPSQLLATSSKFDLPDPPYYVCVHGPYHGWLGSYEFQVQLQLGRSKDEAVPLQPFRVKAVPVTTTFPVNAEDQVWFVFDLDVADSGAPQLVEIAAGGAPGTSWTADLRAADGTTSLATAFPDLQGACRLSQLEAGGTLRYLVMPRNEAGSFTADFVSAVWSSPLTVLFGNLGQHDATPMSLRCTNETDPESGQDDILLSVWVDGNQIKDREFVGRFDAPHVEALEGHFPTPLRYLDRVEIQLFEGDSGSDDDPSGVNTLGTLDGSTVPKGIAHDDVGFEFEGGYYDLFCNRANSLT